MCECAAVSSKATHAAPSVLCSMAGTRSCLYAHESTHSRPGHHRLPKTCLCRLRDLVHEVDQLPAESGNSSPLPQVCRRPMRRSLNIICRLSICRAIPQLQTMTLNIQCTCWVSGARAAELGAGGVEPAAGARLPGAAAGAGAPAAGPLVLDGRGASGLMTGGESGLCAISVVRSCQVQHLRAATCMGPVIQRQASAEAALASVPWMVSDVKKAACNLIAGLMPAFATGSADKR